MPVLTGKSFLFRLIALFIIPLGIVLLVFNHIINTKINSMIENDAKKLSYIVFNNYQADTHKLIDLCFTIRNLLPDLKVSENKLKKIKDKNKLDYLKIFSLTNPGNNNEKVIKELITNLKDKNIIYGTIELNGKLVQIAILSLGNQYYIYAIKRFTASSELVKSLNNVTNSHISPISLSKLKQTDKYQGILQNIESTDGYYIKPDKKYNKTLETFIALRDPRNKPLGLIKIVTNSKEYDVLQYEVFKFLVIAGILCISVAVITAIISDRKLSKTINTINNGVKSASEGDFSYRIEISKNNKLTSIADNINQMFKAITNREYEIKSYQDELRAKKENLEAIFNSSTDGIMTLSSDLKIINVNPTITQWVGLPSEKIVGVSFNELVKCNCDLKMSDIDCADPSVCPIAAYWPEEMPKEANITNKNTNKVTYVALNCSPIHGLTKATESFVAVLMDITELKEIEKMKENFVATLTHDLRVPLLAENLALKYLIKGSYGKLVEQQKLAAENMLKSNEDLLKLVNTLLDVYKYEAGTSQLYKEPINIKRLADECISELSPLAEKNAHLIECNINKELGEIDADKNELKRVFINLISNAISYTPENGNIKIESERNQNFITVKVIDNGKGIPENDIKNIFDRYFSSSKKFRKVGTGLGLYLSKQIISAHGGKIWVESKQGKGSTFYFTLPVNIEEINYDQAIK